jgi:energy-coupling factor transporter ATP-binding protein EcfA2/histidinol phosphatase-like PHP family hydrolase
MTPEAIIATAVAEGLSLISITDHNEITNIERALTAGAGHQLAVIPGIELSTPQGHLLCYFKALANLRRFHGKLTIVDSGTQNSRCQQAMIECLNFSRELEGFCILAHVDAAAGFEQVVTGSSPHKGDVISHPSLLGIELKGAASEIAYSISDADPNRARLGEERISRLELGSKQYLARVLNSDAHTLLTLGRNAENARKVTRYKMDELGFDGLRIALEDADARVRIEDLVPPSIPYVVGIHMDGGFLAGQTIQFSPNLNCIIGGRGTGKSTTFEAVRCLIDDGEPRNPIVDSEVWPEELHLVWRDKAGRDHTLVRPKDGEIVNTNSEDDGPCSFEIDCFGQGEAAKISVQAQSNPLALLHYLDRFTEVGHEVAGENSLRDLLLEQQSKIEDAELKVQMIPQHERILATTQQQLKALQKPDVKELIELQRQLAKEKAIWAEINDHLVKAKRESTSLASKGTAKKICDLADPKDMVVGGAEFQIIQQGAIAFEITVSSAESNIQTGLSTFEAVVKAQNIPWKAKEAEAQKKIDAKRRELESLNVTFDMSYIAKLAKDEATHTQTLSNLKTWVPYLGELKRERSATLANRWKARDRVSALRSAFGRVASNTLREALSDLNVSLKYETSAHSEEAVSKIVEAMGWRTNQQQRATWLVQDLTIPTLLGCIAKQNIQPILKIKTQEGVEVFKADEARSIIEKLAAPTILFALERVSLHDLPRLLVTKKVTDRTGVERFVSRDFSRLSLGQQQSVLLALMLSANSDRPLIIDQPEDNLDGEFIYATLVPVLRRVKERRQVIIVTHNANVAVLGDAEQIVVMKAANDRGEIITRGSIDNPNTRDAACSILEGAREAFLRRAKMYAVRLR